jgi:glycosyltransferase involved in cell wall biosynthesis
MVPRERYSGVGRAIETLYEHTRDVPFNLVVTDGGLPAGVREAIAHASRQRGFRFVQQAYPLAPNEARNIGLHHVDTPWLVFADNDVVFTSNWLPPLLAAAEELGAWLVGPTILDGAIDRGRIHAAGGDAGFDEIDGKRRYHFQPGFSQKKLADVSRELRRGPTSMLEFHVLLARSDALRKIGPLDEGFVSLADHDDLVLSALAAGGTAVYEPGSTVSYHDPDTSVDVLRPGDLPMYLLRWGEAWNRASLRHAVRKWRLDPDDPWIEQADRWMRARRRRAYIAGGLLGRVVRTVLNRTPSPVGVLVERLFCAHHTRVLVSLRARHVAGRP